MRLLRLLAVCLAFIAAPALAQPAAPKGVLPPGSYQAKHVIIATGARPRVLPGIEPDKKLVWTYFEAMAPADGTPEAELLAELGDERGCSRAIAAGNVGRVRRDRLALPRPRHLQPGMPHHFGDGLGNVPGQPPDGAAVRHGGRP